MEGYRRTGHAVYLVTYHIVLVTKYRCRCLDGELVESIKADFTRMIGANKGRVHAIECDRDHVHILAELPIDQPVAKFIGVLKGATSRNARGDYGEQLSKFYWEKEKWSLWSDSYFLASTGGVTLDVVRRYVESQPTKKRKRGNPNFVKRRAHSSHTNP